MHPAALEKNTSLLTKLERAVDGLKLFIISSIMMTTFQAGISGNTSFSKKQFRIFGHKGETSTSSNKTSAMGRDGGKIQ